eukprot:TRINITY_DN22751_c0_g1_i1.p1 TRINITY_DN22751_c0_g1~~TRINITY_DN22751_c0_g1_i1.p1  ORF type:complete len:193 (+),score=21.05 TRINITY_DN22751_c0_g1_i1:2-580(+)
MKFLLFVIAFALVAQVALGQKPRHGACPDIPSEPDFDASKYVGIWYEVERTFTLYELGLKCGRANYTLLPNGTLYIENDSVQKITNKTQIADPGTATNVDPKTPGTFILKFPGGITADLLILDSDYTNYSIHYSCKSYLNNLWHTESLWILSRSPTMSEEMRKELHQKIKNLGLDDSGLNVVEQEGCSNYMK